MRLVAMMRVGHGWRQKTKITAYSNLIGRRTSRTDFPTTFSMESNGYLLALLFRTGAIILHVAIQTTFSPARTKTT